LPAEGAGEVTRLHTLLAAAAVALPLWSCSGISSQTGTAAAPRAGLSSPCTVEVFLDPPARPYEKVTDIDVYVRRNKITGGQRAVYEEAVPELKKRGCEAGADAVLVKNQTVSQSGEWKLLYVGAVAIRYSQH
jgi:hypothetical protein